MSIYKRFCKEEFDENGRLKKLTLDYPDNFNFAYDVVDAIAEEEPDKRAIVWCNRAGDEKIITFGELSRLTNKAANAMKDAGIGRGDRVMISLKRHWEYWIVTVAMHKLGAVMTPVTHMLTADDIVYRLESTEFKAIICTPENDVASRMKEAVARTGQDPILWSVQEDIEGFVNFSVLMEEAYDE
ncbi:MAG: AMP-binding protein, partial [Firmicutes bacterium]|nr:AMP-binding protein [Bacillota bacterium]